METDAKITQAAQLAATVFAAMGWTWADTEPHTPTIREIEKTYRDLLSHVGQSVGAEVSTGRLVVQRTKLGIEFLMELA
jgi:hypothetical protein